MTKAFVWSTLATMGTLFTCAECGGEVKMAARAGRTREQRKGVVLAIPDDFEIPTCARCGEEYLSKEGSAALDALLTWPAYRERVTQDANDFLIEEFRESLTRSAQS
jgi:hypothetical protein